jgi:hypothetical protein
MLLLVLTLASSEPPSGIAYQKVLPSLLPYI